MFIIYLSEANINTLISGLLVLSGVALGPTIAFITTISERNHKQRSLDRANKRPALDSALSYMLEINLNLPYLYQECHQKMYSDVGERTEFLFPKNIIESWKSNNDKIEKIMLSGITKLPKKVLDKIADYHTVSSKAYKHFNEQIIQFDKTIDLSKYDKFVRPMAKQYIKALKRTRKYLGVK